MTYEGTAMTTSFSVIDIDCSDTTYCFGVIKNGSAFCPKRNCGVKSHATVKMPFAGDIDSFVFIRRNIPGSVFSQPKVSSSKISAEVMAEWESKNLMLADWITEFQAVDGTNEHLTSVEDIQIETEFLVESLLLRPPGKRKKDSFGGEEYEGTLPSWKNPKYERSFPSDPVDLARLVEVGVKKGIISTTVSNIETYIEGMGEALGEVATIHQDRLVTLEDNLETLLGMVQTIRAGLGNSVDIGDKFTAPTLWGSTAFIADDLTRITEEFAVLRSDVVMPMKNSLSILESSDKNVSIQNDVNKVIKAAKHLLIRIQSIGDKVAVVKTDLVVIRAEQGVRFADPHSTSLEDAADDLMEYISSEERGAPSSQGRNDHSVATVVTPTKTAVNDDDSHDGEDVRSILAKLIDDVKTLQASKQSSAIKFGNLGIRDLSDCSLWVTRYFSHFPYGLIMDPLVMLDRIYGDDDAGDSSGLMKSMELRYKLKIDSGGEGAALNALRYARPRIFHKGRPTIVSIQKESRASELDPVPQ